MCEDHPDHESVLPLQERGVTAMVRWDRRQAVRGTPVFFTARRYADLLATSSLRRQEVGIMSCCASRHAIRATDRTALGRAAHASKGHKPVTITTNKNIAAARTNI